MLGGLPPAFRFQIVMACIAVKLSKVRPSRFRNLFRNSPFSEVRQVRR